MRSAIVSLLMSVSVGAALSPLPAAAEDADRLFASKFAVDDVEPARAIPNEAERDVAPLDFAYFLMNLSEKAAAAAKAHDPARQIRYLRAIATAVPNRSLGFSRLCAAYEADQQLSAARRSCASAITLPGATLEDFTRLARVVLGQERDLDPGEPELLARVAEHVRRNAPESPVLVDISCQLAIRGNDPNRYRECNAALAQLPDNDVKRVSYGWSWAMARHDYREAGVLHRRARESALPSDLVARMKRVRLSQLPWWQRAAERVFESAFGTGAFLVSTAEAQLRGSDTLEGLTKALLANAACNGGGLTYAGGGSGTGEAAMTSGTQSIAPMSRPLGNNNAVCGPPANGLSSAEAMLFGLDGMVIIADSEQTERCGMEGHMHEPRGVALTSSTKLPLSETTPDVVPSPVYSDLGVGWANKLRAIYWGLPPGTTPTGANCMSSLRQQLFTDYKSLFPNNCAGTTGQENTCGGMSHAFRRGDASGTTDLFRTIMGAGTSSDMVPFCNGTDQQDRDPLRRACDDSEQVCSPDGKLGFVLPVIVPEGDDVNLLYPSGSCPDGRFRYAPAPFKDSSCCFRNPDGTCALDSINLRCPQPVAANDAPCLNGWTLDEFAGNQLVGSRFDFDARVYNLQVRRPGSGELYAFANGTEVTAAYYRIHSTLGGKFPFRDSTALCRESDSTREIGCLVQAPSSGCSIGFAGGESVQVRRAEPLALASIDWTNTTIQNRVTGGEPIYPLSRKLYVSSIKGFQSLMPGPERNLAACFATPSTINPLLDQFGFTRLPSQDPVCEEACPNGPAGAHCDDNPAPFN